MDIQRLYSLAGSLAGSRLRRRRIERFIAAFAPTSETTILDVGGYPSSWSGSSIQAQFTIVNIHRPEHLTDAEAERWNFTIADGRSLPFADGVFDIAFSNSVIEHLSTLESQEAFASEIRRVGRHLWVQTPARSFPIEPHLLTPLIHYLPRRVQRKLMRFTVWGIVGRPSPDRIEVFLDEVRLLSYGEMQRMFPDCQIMRERFLGLTKSYIAVR